MSIAIITGIQVSLKSLHKILKKTLEFKKKPDTISEFFFF